MPTKNKKQSKKMNENIENVQKDGIVGMMISLHTFPIESEDELEEKRKLVDEIKGIDFARNNNTRHNNK